MGPKALLDGFLTRNFEDNMVIWQGGLGHCMYPQYTHLPNLQMKPNSEETMWANNI